MDVHLEVSAFVYLPSWLAGDLKCRNHWSAGPRDAGPFCHCRYSGSGSCRAFACWSEFCGDGVVLSQRWCTCQPQIRWLFPESSVFLNASPESLGSVALLLGGRISGFLLRPTDLAFTPPTTIRWRGRRRHTEKPGWLDSRADRTGTHQEASERKQTQKAEQFI